MAKAKITVIGEIEKFKVHDDGTVNIVIKADTSTSVPTGLKELGSSTYSITVSKKAWKKVSDALQGNRIMFMGEPKAAVTVKGIPFILVNCFEISVIEQKAKEGQPKKAVDPKPVQNEKLKTDHPPIPTKEPTRKELGEVVGGWRKNNAIIQIPFKNVVLEEETHLNYANFRLGKLEPDRVKPMTVRQIADNKYALVMGLQSFVMAKLLDMETVPAILCDATFDELTDQLGITSGKFKRQVTLRQILD